MKFSITPDNFQTVLGQVAAAVPTRSVTPILMNVLVEADERGVRFSATDLDIGLRTRVAAQVEESGRLAVPAKKLLEIVRLLPADMVKIETKGQTLAIRCGKASFNLHGMPAEEYPAFPEIDMSEGWNVPIDTLDTMIERVSFAASVEESRPILNGVLWELRSGTMAMAATDGHRLSRLEAKAESGAGGEIDLIVPPKALAQVRKMFVKEGAIQVARSNNSIAFRQGETLVTARLIEGPYPNYQQVIPRDNDKVATVDNESLQSALRRVAVVASEQTHRVRLAFDKGMLRFAVDTPDLGEAKDEIEVDYTGEPIEIGFNANYLIEVLRAVPSEKVQITMKAPERAALVKPIENGAEVPGQIMLVMPLRLNV